MTSRAVILHYRAAARLLVALAVLGVAFFISSPRSLGAEPNTPTPLVSNAAQPKRNSLANIDPPTRALLKLMMTADRSLDLSGEQTTVLYRPDGKSAVQSTQSILRNGNQGYRCEFHTPPRLQGDLLISRYDTSWHYMPSKKLIRIGSPRGRHLMTTIGPALRALRQGIAQVHTIGDDSVAGHATKILEFTGIGQTASGLIKLWIDPTTGAQLKTEVYGAGGALQSTSYFTQVNYSPTIAANAFDPPTVPPDTKTEFEQLDKQIPRLPTDAEAGFHVLKPTYLPQGYQFQSASIFPVAARKAVSLRYANGLSILSVFQAPAAANSASNSYLRHPRSGMITYTSNGMQYAAMGTLGEDELLNIVKSMR